MKDYEKLMAEMEKGVIFLYNPNEETVVKIMPDGKAFAKFEGEAEYEVNMNTNMVTDAIIAAKQISEKDYNEY